MNFEGLFGDVFWLAWELLECSTERQGQIFPEDFDYGFSVFGGKHDGGAAAVMHR